MTFLSKIKERIETVVAAEAELRTEMSSKIVPDQIKSERMAHCNTCEFLFTPTMQCRKCGCFVKLKTSVSFFKCPVGKWSAMPRENT